MSVLTASLDDIVFEGRNKAYGAYQLRRDYQRNVTKAGTITLGICGLLFAAWATWPATKPKTEVAHKTILDPITPPLTEVEKPKQAVLAPARPPQRRTTTAAAAPPAPAIATQVAPDNLVPPAPVEQSLTKASIDGAAGNGAPGTDSELATGLTTGPGNPGGDGESATAASEPAGPVMFVEKMPEFAGGQAALMRYLRDHLRYPSQALREQAEGRVFMSFVVRADGTIAEATVLKGLGFGLDEEALRVVRQMPAWTPGYQAQRAVAVRFTLPITFKIQ